MQMANAYPNSIDSMTNNAREGSVKRMRAIDRAHVALSRTERVSECSIARKKLSVSGKKTALHDLIRTLEVTYPNLVAPLSSRGRRYYKISNSARARMTKQKQRVTTYN